MPIRVVGCVMACLLVIAWFTVFGVMIRAILLKDILWPQKQEDREEGGWKSDANEKKACDIRRCNTLEEEQRRSEPDPIPTLHGAQVDSEHSSWTEPKEPGLESESSLPVIAENLVEHSVRSRGAKTINDFV